MNKLIVIEGQDRVGKDYLFDKLKSSSLSNELKFYQRPFPPNKPSYRTNPKEFKKWADSYITAQANELAKKNENVIMVRFLLSELVYSSIFKRSTIAHELLSEIKKHFEVYHLVLLFKNYEEYLQRLLQIGEPVEYQEDEFNKVIKQYEIAASHSSDHFKIYRTSKVDIGDVQNTIKKWIES